MSGACAFLDAVLHIDALRLDFMKEKRSASMGSTASRKA